MWEAIEYLAKASDHGKEREHAYTEALAGSDIRSVSRLSFILCSAIFPSFGITNARVQLMSPGSLSSLALTIRNCGRAFVGKQLSDYGIP